MVGLIEEAARHVERRRAEAAEAAQAAALQLLVGADLRRALEARSQDREELARRLRRCLERERLRGLRRHWSYDLNRHIALKQALDRIQPPGEHDRIGTAASKAIGARKRRSSDDGK